VSEREWGAGSLTHSDRNSKDAAHPHSRTSKIWASCSPSLTSRDFESFSEHCSTLPFLLPLIGQKSVEIFVKINVLGYPKSETPFHPQNSSQVRFPVKGAFAKIYSETWQCLATTNSLEPLTKVPPRPDFSSLTSRRSRSLHQNR
jgi:hypothetical protein